VSALASNISNTPVELIESESPLLVEEYGLVKDSEGAGQFRGGLAVTRTWRLLGVDEAQLLVRSDRLKFAPYGLKGGQTGTRGCNSVHTREGERAMPSKFQTTLREGERIRIQTAGTGGWGDPLDRDPRQVAQDVLDGRVSLERAYQVYGVAIDATTMQVDLEATSESRKRLQSARANGEEIKL
jgi:N-methylhydantoinase B